MSTVAFAKKLAKVAAKWPTCVAFAAVANVAAQRPDGVGVAWIRQFQAEVRRALKPALNAGPVPVATAEGKEVRNCPSHFLPKKEIKQRRATLPDASTQTPDARRATRDAHGHVSTL